MCLNILVDPNGDAFECSETPLTPDRTPQLSTWYVALLNKHVDANLVVSPKLKNQLFSGLWSVILMSNNRGAGSIAYQRDFDLSVGIQQTITVTPTIVVPYTSTFILNATCEHIS